MDTRFNIEDCIFTIKEAHQHAKASRSEFYKLIKAGEIKTVKRGARRFVPGIEMKRYINKLASRAA
jgi:helix-turn-helix protein